MRRVLGVSSKNVEISWMSGRLRQQCRAQDALFSPPYIGVEEPFFKGILVDAR